MNDNPVGTPNPLNPAAPAASEPVAAEPVAAAEPEVAAPKKKKTGLIVSLIVGLIAVVGGAVAAILILFVFKPTDAVPAAMAKILSGEVKSFAINGTITANSSDSSFPISNLTVNLDAKIDTASKANSITADVNTSISGMDLNFAFEERQSSDGDAFVKITGISDSVKGMMTSMLSQTGIDCDEVDCDAMIEQMMSSSEAGQFALIASIEDEWLHANSDSFAGIGGNITNNQTQCLVDALSGASNYSKDIKENYEKNSFVTYSTENIPITKKKDTIYKLGLDYAKMAAFINAMQNSALANDLLACSGASATKKDVTESDVQQMFSNFPTVYAEIDNDNNFTRLYFAIDQINLVADLSISYPGSVTVEKPSNYLEMSDYLSDLMQSLGGFTSYGTTVIEDSDYDY